MKSKIILVLKVALIILAADHLTKWLVVKKIPYGGGFAVIEGYFDLVHYRNRGAAFGLFSNWDSVFREAFFYVLALVAIFFLFSLLKQIHKKMSIVAVGLILGGALGNILDRVLRGSVVDFLSLHWGHEQAFFSIFGKSFQFALAWPAFNVADSAITVGVLWLFLFVSLFQGNK